jgi:hypothetical protein
LGLCLALSVATPVLAQPRLWTAGISTSMLAGQKSVQEDVKLTEDQVAKAKKVSEDVNAKYVDALKAAARDYSRQEQVRRTIREETDKALANVLKPDQLKRIRQIEIQLAGLTAFTFVDVSKEVRLNLKQNQDWQRRHDELEKESREIFKDVSTRDKLAEATAKVRTLSQEAAAKFVSTLSDEQKAAYRELTGKKFDGKIEPPMRVRPGQND